MHLTTQPLLDLAALEAVLPELAERYAGGRPYPHIVLDDVLEAGTLARVYEEFATIPDDAWTNYLHLNERKYGNTRLDTWGPTMRAVAEAFASERFVAFLSTLTGIEGLRADDVMDGGGLHRSMAGGFLNVHSDFNAHHSKPRWRRRVNLLLYLNPEWRPEWGGELQLWSKDMKGCVSQIEPIGNRILAFNTDQDSLHGHPEALRFPEGVARQSLALYYFTEEDVHHPRSTNYRARPGDGFRGAFIHLDTRALELYDILKRRLRLTDGRVSQALGALSRARRRH